MLPPRAYIFISLNIIRTLSILALILVFSSNIVTLVHDIQAVNRFMAAKVADTSNNSTMTDMLNCDYIEDSTVPNQPAGVFWAVTNRLLIIGQTVVLVLSELGWPASFFTRFFPVLGKEFGLGCVGCYAVSNRSCYPFSLRRRLYPRISVLPLLPRMFEHLRRSHLQRKSQI